jgi:hypothetical protein
LIRLTGRCAIWLGVLAALIVTVVIGFQPLLHLDRQFLPDDTYYTLSISRNIAAGLGPTTDGMIATSGFQPLIALLQVPAFWFSNDPWWPVAWTIAISGLFGIISVINLDGVVSGPAHAALQDRKLAAFMQRENIGYFADWRVNRDMFSAFAGIPDPLSVLQEPQPMPPQQKAQFTIYRIVWP